MATGAASLNTKKKKSGATTSTPPPQQQQHIAKKTHFLFFSFPLFFFLFAFVCRASASHKKFVGARICGRCFLFLLLLLYNEGDAIDMHPQTRRISILVVLTDAGAVRSTEKTTTTIARERRRRRGGLNEARHTHSDASDAQQLRRITAALIIQGARCVLFARIHFRAPSLKGASRSVGALQIQCHASWLAHVAHGT